MRRSLLALGITGLLVAGCREPSDVAASSPDAAVTADPDEQAAGRLLEQGAALPSRAEVVALADRLSIRAARASPAAERLPLLLLAARLRERCWRFERRSADAGEALELYRSAIELGPGSADSCRAELPRAQLAGELAADARVLFRELYIAQERQRAVLTDGESAEAEQCLQSIGRQLQLAEGARPAGELWQRLESDARAASAALRDKQRAHVEAGVGTSLAGARDSAAASSSVPSAESASSPMPTRVVVTPDDKQLGKGPVDLQKVQPFSWEHGGRVVITLSAPASYTVDTLEADPSAGRGYRVYLDIARAKARGLKAEIPAQGLVERIRLGKQPNGTRVVLDLAERATQKVFYLPEPFRIVVDLGTRPSEPAPAASVGGQRVVRRVTLDPGHGGDDHGAIGPTGLREKDVTLDVAHRAAPAIAHELGIETMLTRDTDGYVFLEERIARANAFHADLFVSLHCNATEDGHARGMQLFVLDPSREVDAVSQRVARRENALLGGLRAMDPGALDEHVATVAAGLNVKALTERSNLLAELLRKSTLASTTQSYPSMKDYGIKTAGFYVLMGAEMPAVLYEMAFISNPDDEAQLATADFRQKLADSVVNAIRAYREGR